MENDNDREAARPSNDESRLRQSTKFGHETEIVRARAAVGRVFGQEHQAVGHRSGAEAESRPR